VSKPESNESCKAPLLKLWNEIRICQSVRHRREALTRQREVGDRMALCTRIPGATRYENMYADR
jgi:hypothetical protein